MKTINRAVRLLRILLVVALISMISSSVYKFIRGKPTEINWINKDHFIVKTYFDNGNIRAKRELNKDTVFDGRTVMYYENGQVWLENNYKNGKKDGKETAYRQNGTTEYIGNYKNGNQDSIWHWYYNNSQRKKVRIIENYFNGKPFAGQLDYYINNSFKSYKFYSFEGMLGLINFDSLSQNPKLTGRFNYTMYNRNKFKLGEEFTSMVYLGVPPDWKSDLLAIATNKKGESVEMKCCTFKKSRVDNSDKYYFDCKFKDRGIYSIENITRIWSDENKLMYSDTSNLEVTIE